MFDDDFDNAHYAEHWKKYDDDANRKKIAILKTELEAGHPT